MPVTDKIQAPSLGLPGPWANQKLGLDTCVSA